MEQGAVTGVVLLCVSRLMFDSVDEICLRRS